MRPRPLARGIVGTTLVGAALLRLGRRRDYSDHLLTLRIDQDHFAFDQRGLQSLRLWDQFRNCRRHRCKLYAARYQGANSRPKTHGRSIVLLGLGDTLIDGLLLRSCEIDVR